MVPRIGDDADLTVGHVIVAAGLTDTMSAASLYAHPVGNAVLSPRWWDGKLWGRYGARVRSQFWTASLGTDESADSLTDWANALPWAIDDSPTPWPCVGATSQSPVAWAVSHGFVKRIARNLRRSETDPLTRAALALYCAPPAWWPSHLLRSPMPLIDDRTGRDVLLRPGDVRAAVTA